MAGGRRAEREVQVRDSAQRAAAVVMPIDFRTMRDTSDGGATILLGNGRPYRAVAQSRGSIRSMSASPVGKSGSLSHSETITVVFTAKKGSCNPRATRKHAKLQETRRCSLARPTWLDGLDLSAGRHTVYFTMRAGSGISYSVLGKIWVSDAGLQIRQGADYATSSDLYLRESDGQIVVELGGFGSKFNSWTSQGVFGWLRDDGAIVVAVDAAGTVIPYRGVGGW